MTSAPVTSPPALPRASEQGGTYPRPQLLRAQWADLTGPWDFAFDDDDAGRAAGWQREGRFDRVITVPFPPESPASGIGDPSPHRVLWYARDLDAADLRAAGHDAAPGNRLLLHFGAVDYRCQVWLDGQLVGSHQGGQTPFVLDVTELVGLGDGDGDGDGDGSVEPAARHRVVVRVEDDPADIAQPRGKQDWLEEPHVIWYHRTSGIWQTVWLESVPAVHVTEVFWRSDPAAGTVRAQLSLSRELAGERVRVALDLSGQQLAAVEVTGYGSEVDVVVPVAALANGQSYEDVMWSPEHPRLVDARIEVGHDVVASYLGIRTVAVARGLFLLNDRPRYVRSVLNQGYWPDSHLAAPDAAALRAEVELIQSLGFNAARLHQKFEDPRFLYWADRLGLMVWGEAPASFTFSTESVTRGVTEWLDAVRRDRSHPSVVTWVPQNESWGVQHLAHVPAMAELARAMVALTKALDPTRPVVSNDGWEQVDTDVVAIHDYEHDPAVIEARYRDRAAVDAMIDGYGPAGRRLVLRGDVTDAPVMLTEFGGISFDIDHTDDAWGYSAATSAEDLDRRLAGIMGAVHASAVLAGFCYTQLTDTLQETNGLVGSDRKPKLPVARIRELITGVPQHGQTWRVDQWNR